MAVASMVCGIIGVCASLGGFCICFFPLIGLPLSGVAIILGAVELNSIRTGKSPPAGKGMAIAGLVTGIFGAVVALLSLVLMIAVWIFFFLVAAAGEFQGTHNID